MGLTSGARLLAEHAETAPDPGREQRIHEAQSRYPAAHVYYDTDVDDIVIDVSSGER
jgi:hypothetical protein